MDEFLSRTEPVASVSGIKDRGFSGTRSLPAAVPGEVQAEASALAEPQVTERSEAAANYARIQADIADVIARLDPAPIRNVSDAAAAATQALVDLMPQPVVVLPLPPTDPNMIAFVAQVAQSLASRAAMARAAQARVSAGVVDQVIQYQLVCRTSGSLQQPVRVERSRDTASAGLACLDFARHERREKGVRSHLRSP